MALAPPPSRRGCEAGGGFPAPPSWIGGAERGGGGPGPPPWPPPPPARVSPAAPAQAGLESGLRGRGELLRAGMGG